MKNEELKQLLREYADNNAEIYNQIVKIGQEFAHLAKYATQTLGTYSTEKELQQVERLVSEEEMKGAIEVFLDELEEVVSWELIGKNKVKK